MIEGSHKHSELFGQSHWRRAFSLVELLIVIAVLGIVAGFVLTRSEPSVQSQLESAAQMVAADLAQARNLAVTNNSSYRITFDATNNRYSLEHSGSNPLLDDLPAWPFDAAPHQAHQRITDLNDLPGWGVVPRLITIRTSSDGDPDGQVVTDLEFGAFGETSRTEESIVWLAAGDGEHQFFLPIHVNPVTGLATIGELQAAPTWADGGTGDSADDAEDDGSGDDDESTGGDVVEEITDFLDNL